MDLYFVCEATDEGWSILSTSQPVESPLLYDPSSRLDIQQSINRLAKDMSKRNKPVDGIRQIPLLVYWFLLLAAVFIYFYSLFYIKSGDVAQCIQLVGVLSTVASIFDNEPRILAWIPHKQARIIHSIRGKSSTSKPTR